MLVNVPTYQTLISFGSTSYATTCVQQRGPLVIFGTYIGMLFLVSGFIPLFYFYGKRASTSRPAAVWPSWMPD